MAENNHSFAYNSETERMWEVIDSRMCMIVRLADEDPDKARQLLKTYPKHIRDKYEHLIK